MGGAMSLIVVPRLWPLQINLSRDYGNCLQRRGVKSGSDRTRNRDLRRDRPALRSTPRLPVARAVPPVAGVVLLENGLQSVGEGVGGTDSSAREPTSQAKFRRSHPGGRRFES